MPLRPDSIHQAIYEPRPAFLRPSPLAPHCRAPLRTGRERRRAYRVRQRRRPLLSSGCLLGVEPQFNTRTRQVLNDQTPARGFTALVVP